MPTLSIILRGGFQEGEKMTSQTNVKKTRVYPKRKSCKDVNKTINTEFGRNIENKYEKLFSIIGKN